MPFFIENKDITTINADAIVNAANNTLLGGGGVDGAIHRAAGPELKEECATLCGCETGMAKITKGYKLPAKYVIHTVGPVWKGGKKNEEELLRSCYSESLKLAAEYNCESVVFPLISSGAYRYPKDRALAVAVDEIRKFLAVNEMTVILTIVNKKEFVLPDGVLSNVESHINAFHTGSRLSVFKSRSKRKPKLQLSQKESLPRPKRNNTGEAGDVFTGMDFSIPEKPSKPRKMREEMCANELPTEAPALCMSVPEKFETDESFSEMLFRLIDLYGLTDVEAYTRSNIDRRVFSKIRSNKNYRPSKETAVAFVFGLNLDSDTAAELLRKAGYAFSDSILFDVIVKYYIEQGNYDIYYVNEVLFYYDQKLLGNVAS